MLSFILFVSLPLTTAFSAEIRVCQSPGCLDDGARETLDYLTSLAPPDVRVGKGRCLSLCGAGPVVEVIKDGSGASSLKEKKVAGEKMKNMIIKWHDSNDGDVLKPYQITGRVQGYEESIQAREAYDAKDFEGALELCTFAIQDARKPAMLLQEARDRDSSAGCESNEELGFPVEMRWLIETFKVSCRCRLVLGDVEKARSDAFAATIFSKNSDPDAHECLAEVCKATHDLIGELQALKAAVGQYNRIEELCSKPQPGADAPSRAQNTQRKMKAAARKRELGFRINSLTNELTTS